MEKKRPNAISGLIDKRRVIARQIELVQRELRALVTDLDHIDAAMRIFDLNANIGPAKRYPAAHGARWMRRLEATVRQRDSRPSIG